MCDCNDLSCQVCQDIPYRAWKFELDLEERDLAAFHADVFGIGMEVMPTFEEVVNELLSES